MDSECSDRYEFHLYYRSLFPRSLVVAQYILLEDSTSCGLNEIFLSIYAAV
jgi:hypothetical protein